MKARSIWVPALLLLALPMPGSLSVQHAPLSATRLTASVDTFDNYTGEAMAAMRGRTSYVRTIAPRAGGFAITYTWLDSLNAITTVQATGVRTADAATDWQRVRSPSDSATLLTSNGRVAGWVVPGGEKPTLFDAALTEPLLDPNVVELAFAATRPAVGKSVAFNTYALYSAAPVAPIADTMTVGALVDLQSANGPIKAVEVKRARVRFWFDAATGMVLARQGSAASGRIIWWHVRRGVGVPQN